MRTTLWTATALLAAGCGGSGPNVAPVTGRITLDGKPLANATVNFQPIASGNNINPGSGSYGKTDADGRYTLRLVDRDREGAVVGNHRVEISALSRPQNVDNDRERAPPNLVPPQYNRNTTLTFEVRPGENVADWPLKSK
jgi:hypothetical protein